MGAASFPATSRVLLLAHRRPGAIARSMFGAQAPLPAIAGSLGRWADAPDFRTSGPAISRDLLP